jgi:hypothetical protein
MKKKFTEALILLLPNSQKLFLLESNTLKWAMEAVLKQQDVNGEWCPCGYLSQRDIISKDPHIQLQSFPITKTSCIFECLRN